MYEDYIEQLFVFQHYTTYLTMELFDFCKKGVTENLGEIVAYLLKISKYLNLFLQLQNEPRGKVSEEIYSDAEIIELVNRDFQFKL